MGQSVNPLDQWQKNLEQTLAALGIETGYDAEAVKVKQAEFIAAQQKKEGENEATE